MDLRSAKLHPTRDHVVPRHRGGREIVICCSECNTIKGGMGEQEWLRYMRENAGWWLLTRAERRRRARAARRPTGAPDGRGNIITARGPQGSPPLPPVVVPPELIFGRT